MARDFASAIDVYPDHDALDITSNMTFACWTYPDTLGMAGRWLVLRDQHFAFNNGSDGIHSFVWWDGANARRMRPSSIGTGAWKHVCFQVQSNDCHKFWLNGVDSSVSVSNWFAASRVLTNQMDIGGRTSVGEYWDGRICEVAIWNVVLDAAEIGALNDGYSAELIRPSALKFYDQMVRGNVNRRGPAATTVASTAANTHPRIIMPRRRHARRFGAAAGAYTLTAAAGSFTETGQDAGLLAARLITGETGAFTETGQDAGLLVGRVVTGEAGTFALTGNDATLTYTPAGAYTLAADAGTFAETGQDAGLLAARRITGEAGAFAETGQDAGLYVGRVVAADAGSFTETGQAASLTAARLLAGGVGAYTLGGQDAALNYSGATGVTLTAAAGAIALSGVDAALTYSGPVSRAATIGGRAYPLKPATDARPLRAGGPARPSRTR